jgi:hypothetical protein
MQAPIIVATYLSHHFYQAHKLITCTIEQYIDHPIALICGESLEELTTGQVDLGFISGSSYRNIASQFTYPVEPLAAALLLGAWEPLLQRFGPASVPVIVAAKQLDDALKARIRTTLCNIHTDPLVAPTLRRSSIDRFIPITRQAYQDTRSMLEHIYAQGMLHQTYQR